MADLQVTCHTPDNNDMDRRIQGLGGAWGWKGIDTLIDEIQRGTNRYWTTAHGRSVWVVAQRHPQSARLYLTTEGDGYPPNNLLSLSRC
ncbi:DUF3892 domain-containing protein [Sphingomonas sp. LY54]|uniref:DUF3892 domain-containing protein n=1 Tax=Sphingomonas sp. LY54 TaxID=3095343 RepID=UPI002D7826F6|nr:DUF3892 domain-containing protein [Sphingomonas sp. LY54]WRP27226.1 DUF3892 domain-containing protein [Sphingomonas sp. LY54]